MRLFHKHNMEVVSSYDRQKVLIPSILATPDTDEEEIDYLEVTDVLQQCKECNKIEYHVFNGHHSAALDTQPPKSKARKK